MASRLTTTKVKYLLKSINRQIKVLGSYSGSDQPIKCKCLKCNHTWFPVWDNLKAGKGCPQCGFRRVGDKWRLTLDEVKKRLSKLNSTIEILSKEYKNEFQPIRCQCLICGHKWPPLWVNLSKGHGCPRCGQNRTNQKLSLKLRFTLSHVKERLRQINPNVKIIGQYKSALSPLECQCLHCDHIWNSRWNSLQSGSGCPHCWSSKFEREVRTTLGRLTGRKFPRCRPKFLKGFGRQPLEIDCYNEELKLGVECQDESHYRPHWSDRKKRTAGVSLTKRKRNDWRKKFLCRYHGVKLICIPYWIKDLERYLRKRLPKQLVIRGSK